MSVQTTTTKFKDRMAKLLRGRRHQVVGFVLSTLFAAVVFLIMGLTIISATSDNFEVGTSVINLSLYQIIYNMFHSIGLQQYDLGAYQAVLGIAGCGLFIIAFLMLFFAGFSFLSYNKKVVNCQSVCSALASLLLLACVIMYFLIGKELQNIYGSTLKTSSVALYLTIMPLVFCAIFFVLSSVFVTQNTVAVRVKFAPLIIAGIATMVCGVFMFSGATVATPAAAMAFGEYLAAAKKGDVRGLAKALYEEGSREYIACVETNPTVDGVDEYKNIKYSVYLIEENYAALNVSFTLSNGGEPRQVVAHMGRRPSGWYLMSEFNFISGNTYDSAFFLFEKFRYRYDELNGCYTILGVMNAEDVSKIIIPSTYKGKPIVAIAKNAFKNLTNLLELYVHDGVVSIGSQAFVGCPELSIIRLPEGIILDEDAFNNM